MQFQFAEKMVAASHEASFERKRWYFVRGRGFTAYELLSLPAKHDIFKEDTTLLSFRESLRKKMNTKTNPLIEAIFDEETKLQPDERMNKHTIIWNFFAEGEGVRELGIAPCGERRAWAAWAASAGDAASKLWYILLALTFTVSLQKERSGKHVKTTHQRLLPSLQQQGLQPGQQVQKCSPAPTRPPARPRPPASSACPRAHSPTD